MNKVFADFVSYPGKAGLKDFYEKEAFLNPDELVRLRGYFDSLPMQDGATRSESGSRGVGGTYRSSRVGWIPRDDHYQWLYQKLGQLVHEANQQLWQFDLFGMAEPIQITEYHASDDGHYDWHTDVGAGKTSLRKLSITVQLSESEDYEGGLLQFMSRRAPQDAKKLAGTAYVFPSYLLHKVQPVTRGVRRSIVVWVSGPPFR